MRYFTVSFHLIDNEIEKNDQLTIKDVKSVIKNSFDSYVRISKLKVIKHSPVMIKANPKLYKLRKEEKK